MQLLRNLLSYFFVLFTLSITVEAQQAIINMPSADITPEGQLFIMHETQMRKREPGSFWYGTNFFTYGMGRNTEFAITTYNHGTPAARNSAVGVGFKSAIPLYKKKAAKYDIKLTLGQMFIINTSQRGLGNFSYAHGSFKIPKSGTRITGGISVGSTALFKRNTTHFIGAIEQKVNKRFYLVAEWFAGRHDFGFLVPGVLFHPTDRSVVVVGYKIPNHISNGKPGLVLELGFFLGGKK